jgi:replicative DNA helicase
MNAPVNFNAPSAVESEIALLSALLASPTAIESAGHIVTAADFLMPQHAAIYSAVKRMETRGVPSHDHELVINELRDMGTLETVGGRGAIVELFNAYTPTTTAEHHARAVLEKSQRRQFMAIAEQMLAAAADPSQSIDVLAQRAGERIVAVSDKGAARGTSVSLGEGLDIQWKEVEFVTNGGQVPGRMPTRFHDMKPVLRGYKNSSIYMWAGRPGSGKSSLMHAESVCHARYFLSEHKAAKPEERKPLLRAVIYSLEMPVSQVVDAIASMEARVPFAAIDDRMLTAKQAKALVDATAELSKLPIDIVDDLMCYEDIEADIKARHRRGELGIAYIDQLNLMETTAGFTGNDSERLKINSIMKKYKRLAKAIKRPLVMLHQIGRKGAGGEPQLEDLKESGMTEESSDAVIFIVRDMDEAETLQPGELQDTTLIVKKNRHGRMGRATISFDGTYKSFVSKARIAQNGNGR